MPYEPEKIREVYIRVCRDTGFKMDSIDAAKFTGKLLGLHPIEVACCFPYLSVMAQVADGTHPATMK